MTYSHTRAWLLVGVLAATGVLSGCRSQDATRERPANATASAAAATTGAPSIRVVALGDSLTAGYGLDSAAEAYPASRW